MANDTRPNIVQLKYQEVLKISNELACHFSYAEYKRILSQPAYRKLYLEIRPSFPADKYEVVYCSIAPKELVAEQIKEKYPEEDSEEIYDFVLIQTFYVVSGGNCVHMYNAVSWFTPAGISTACTYSRDDLPESIRDFTKNNMKDIVQTFMGIQHIMLKENSIRIRKEYRRGLKSKSENATLQYPFSAPGKVNLIYMQGSLEQTVEEMARKYKEYIRHCPAWCVRGHYRHMKSGKTVYVRAHIKGQRKELYEGRIYELIQEEG